MVQHFSSNIAVQSGTFPLLAPSVPVSFIEAMSTSAGGLTLNKLPAFPKSIGNDAVVSLYASAGDYGLKVLENRQVRKNTIV